MNFQMYKMELENAEEAVGSSKNKRVPKKKNPLLLHWLCQNILLFESNKLWKIYLKSWENQTTLPVSCKTSMKVKEEQLELDMEQQTGSK